MRQKNKTLLQRGLWYLLGLVLFYAPFAVIARIFYMIMGFDGRSDIHATCLRSSVLSLSQGTFARITPLMFLTLITFITVTFFFGPLFCGKLCFAGAFTEYCSRLLPDRFKIKWHKILPPIPVRYGFLCGYFMAPILSSSICCSFCNFSFMQRLLTGGFFGDIGVLTSSAILTFLIWMLLFGIFNQGGRGFCNYMCPIGALQNLIYFFSSKLKFTYKITISNEKCVKCGNCVDTCPMGALSFHSNVLTYNKLHCITCKQCCGECPTKALAYRNGSLLGTELEVLHEKV